MTTKRLISFVICFIALIALVVVAMSMFSKNAPAPTAPLEVVVTEQPTPPEAVPMETKKVKEKYYSIDLEYPKSSSTERKEIAAFVEEVQNDFLDFLPKTEEEAKAQGVDEDRAYALNMTTTVYTSSTTITYKLETYMFTGGAHGGTSVATFTYDKDGRLVTLQDVIGSSDALEKISTSARTYFYNKFKGQITKEEIDAGTEPTNQNFGTWYLTDEGITFIFQQYQIGPYVLGIQEFSL